MDAFGHVTFDAAFQLECQSSEESDHEQPLSTGPGTLIVHPLPWRSTRLLAFHALLDRQYLTNMRPQPRRGVGRRARRAGEPRDATRMPPKGVRRWMISERWWKQRELDVKDLESILDKGEGEDEIDWASFGLEVFSRDEREEKRDEEDGQGVQHQLTDAGDVDHTYDEQHLRSHYRTCSTSSLHNALARVL